MAHDATMGLKTKITRKGNHVQQYAETMRKYRYAHVTVGVHSDDNGDYAGSGVTTAQVGFWNEYGTPNAKHPIPERSFLRSAMRENAGKIERWRAEAVRRVMEDGWSVEKALTMIGLRLQLLVQDKVKSNLAPPNAPWTRARKEELKQGANTLIATRQLLNSIKFQVHLGQ